MPRLKVRELSADMNTGSHRVTAWLGHTGNGYSKHGPDISLQLARADLQSGNHRTPAV